MVSPYQAATISLGNDPSTSFAEDVSIFEFPSSKYEGERDITRNFFDITTANELAGIDQNNIICMFTVGYPSLFTEYIIDDADIENVKVKELKSLYSRIFLQTAADIPSMEFHRSMRIHRDGPVSISYFDGFSGSPVFFVHQDRGKQCHLGFSGIIRLGANEIFHIYEASYLQRILDTYIEMIC